MRHWQCLTAAAALACCTSAQALTAADPGYDDRNTQYGTWLQFGLPLLGLGLTYVLTPRDSGGSDGAFASGYFAADDDSAAHTGWFGWNHMNGRPAHDFWLAFGRMEVITYGLKYTVPASRPNGADHSFPSGHTAAAFMGAEFIRKEYGWWWGAPAFGAASYVGWTRQQSRNHYTRDVLAGAAIGVLSNHDISEFTTRAGHVSLGVSLLAADSPRSALGEGRGAPDLSINPRELPPTVPALVLHLDF